MLVYLCAFILYAASAYTLYRLGRAVGIEIGRLGCSNCPLDSAARLGPHHRVGGEP